MVIKLSADKNSRIITEFDNEVKIDEYAKAYQIYDLMHGKSKGREWKSSFFFILSLIMFFILTAEKFNLSKIPVTAIVLLISMYMCTYYLYLLQKKAKLQGEHIYKSSHLLSKKYHFIINRNFFTVKNEFEYIKRYYTEITDCIETDEIFVLIGGMEHGVNVISKRCLTKEQSELLSEYFKSEMVNEYRRTKSSKKGK